MGFRERIDSMDNKSRNDLISQVAKRINAACARLGRDPDPRVRGIAEGVLCHCGAPEQIGGMCAPCKYAANEDCWCSLE
ncbi:hypothetical protein SEA_JONJAMES_170 [Gordonia Phage JonJames]|nr:hypothetical protein SEA_JONJAMES_170 [Gordonia Phage JonJames]